MDARVIGCRGDPSSIQEGKNDHERSQAQPCVDQSCPSFNDSVPQPHHGVGPEVCQSIEDTELNDTEDEGLDRRR